MTMVAGMILAVSISIAKSQAPSPLETVAPATAPTMTEPTAMPDQPGAPATDPAVAPAPVTPGEATPQTTEATPQATVDEVIRVIPETPRAVAEISSTDENLINVTVENETLENVVNMFTRISGANIVTTTDDLKGMVTVNLRNVQWRPALNSILDIHKLTLVEKMPGSGVYSIVPKPPQDSEPLVNQTVFLKFTTVPELQPMLSSMLAPVSNAMISTLPTRNAMVIKTTEPNMQQMMDVIALLDVPGKQVIVETKFMELTDSASKQLGIRWDSLEGFRLKLDAGPLSYGRNVSRVGTRNNLQESSDVRTRNTSSSSTRSTGTDEARMFDADGNVLEDITFSIFDPTPDNVDNDDVKVITKKVPTTTRTREDGTLSSSSDNRDQRDATFNDSGDSYRKSVGESQGAILSADTFEFVLSALKQTAGVTIVSNPKLIVASGSTDAFFSVGEREPIIKSEIERATVEGQADLITSELDTTITTDFIKQGYLETGIQLLVVPTVKTDDLIEAAIKPRLSKTTGVKTIGENSWPIISVKELGTSFTLRSGQTVAIGGLTDTTDSKKVTKIPLLGDIPLLGKYLFSHTSDVKSQFETIIFVTLTLAEPDMLYQEAGIPQQSELVHKQLLRDGERRRAFEAELEVMKEATRAKAAADEKARQKKIEAAE